MKKYTKDKKQIVDSLIRESYKEYGCPKKPTTEKEASAKFLCYKLYIEGFVDMLFSCLNTQSFEKDFVEIMHGRNYDTAPFGQYLWKIYSTKKGGKTFTAKYIRLIVDAIMQYVSTNYYKKMFDNNMNLLKEGLGSEGIAEGKVCE